VFKAGVVYVQEGQEDQKLIFRNDAGPRDYLDFLSGIGWNVDLATHAYSRHHDVTIS
jgi:hypothetical protein